TPMIVGGLLNSTTIIQVSAGYLHTIALSIDGALFAWGHNLYRQLGDGTTSNTNEPVAVGRSLTGKNIIDVTACMSHTVALSSDGKVFTWGLNTFGRLGDGTQINHTSVIEVGGALNGTNIIQVACDYHTVALSSDGKVFTWG